MVNIPKMPYSVKCAPFLMIKFVVSRILSCSEADKDSKSSIMILTIASVIPPLKLCDVVPVWWEKINITTIQIIVAIKNILLSVLKFLYVKEPFEISLIVEEAFKV